jgi:SAM-dependent methyltransferase
MSYKVFLWDNLSSIEWSQVWRLAGQTDVDVNECEIEQVRDVLLRALPRDGLIIDAGCGDGKWPVFLRRRGYRVIALDIAHEGVRRARVAEPGLMALQADVRRTPLRDGALDGVISLGVVEHDENGPQAALAEARRILKPGGTLVLAVPFNNLWRRCIGNHIMSWVTQRRRADGHSLGFNEYRFSKRELRAYLHAAGFEPLAAYPNDLDPPRNMGLWVDWNNAMFNPLRPNTGPMFEFPGIAGRFVNLLQRRAPWLISGEVVFVCRAV